MRFFDQQSARRRQSVFLLLCFLAAMLVNALIIHIGVVSVSHLMGEQGDWLVPSVPAIALITIAWLTILFGAAFRTLDVSSGGETLAKRFGAVPASNSHRSQHEKQLIAVVAEMAVASGNLPPSVYVLPHESSINALVLGAGFGKQAQSRYVLIVTQGALDHLNRDQLKAMVAHEFGHITNGDIPLNMRLLIVLSGLMALYEVGRLLVGKHPSDFFHPGVLVGYLLIALSSVGVISGQLIRSAFSRQREYLADACALQFTRNPQALASTLHRIQQQQREPSLHSVYAEELAHLCFQAGNTKPWYRRWYRSLLSSHPPVHKRIVAIDPLFDKKQRYREPENNRDKTRATSAGTGVGMSPAATGIMTSSPAISGFSNSLDPLSAFLTNSIVSPDDCAALLFSLFVSTENAKHSGSANVAPVGLSEDMEHRVTTIMALHHNDLQKNHMALIDHAVGQLNQHTKAEQRSALVQQLAALISPDRGSATNGQCLMDYARLQIIASKLGVTDSVTSATDRRPDQQVDDITTIKSFDAMGEEFALLLSLIVESSGAPDEQLDEQFARVMSCYTGKDYSRRDAKASGTLPAVMSAFHTLQGQPRPVREAFVQHCLEIIAVDGKILDAERALVDLFAISLGCYDKAA